MTEARSVRPRHDDVLGLRRALSDRLLPVLVGAMTFLAALALGGAIAAASLARHWQESADTLSVVVPELDTPAGTASRGDAVFALLHATAGIGDVRRPPANEFRDMLRTMGLDHTLSGLALPALFDAHVTGDIDQKTLEERLAQIAPGAVLERTGDWLRRLHRMMLSVQACAVLALLLVVCTAAAIISMATRAGLAAARDTIEILHGLGATDGFIAHRFAGRIGMLTLSGAMAGALVAVSVLLTLADLATPFTHPAIAPASMAAASPLPGLPAALWAGIASLPVAASLIGWLTAQASVRLWLARLP